MVGSQPLLAMNSRIRKSPYFEATLRWGCTAFTIYNHMYMPSTYRGLVEDYWPLVHHASLWDVAVQRQVEISGPDAFAFLRRLTPRNLDRFEIGQCKYLLITDDRGVVINDPVALRLEDNHFWLSLADSDILLWAKGLAQGWDMDVEITEPDVSPLQLQGPASKEVIRALFGNVLDDLGYFRFRSLDLDGIPLIISRTGWSNEFGYELYLRDHRFGGDLWERIMAAGRDHGIAPGAPSPIRRIEAGLLSQGADMGRDENPFELGLARLVDLEQDVDFVGRHALEQVGATGPKRRLVGLVIDGPPLASVNVDFWPVDLDEQPVGRVTSAIYSPRLQRNIALAMLATDRSEPGRALRVAVDGGHRTGSVHALPFVDPDRRLARGLCPNTPVTQAA